MNIEKILNGKSWRKLNLQFNEIRKNKQKNDFTITMPKELYINCVKFWGNTVLNKLIAKGSLSV